MKTRVMRSAARRLVGLGGFMSCLACAANQARPPVPPHGLPDRLREQYPLEALVAGRSGSARVEFAVGADGQLEILRVLSSSEPAFGTACGRMLAGSAWAPALDAAGKPTHRRARFECRFEAKGRLVPPLPAAKPSTPEIPTGVDVRLHSVIGPATASEVRVVLSNTPAPDWIACMGEDAPKQTSLHRLLLRADKCGRIAELHWVDPAPAALDGCVRQVMERVLLPAKRGPSLIALSFQFVVAESAAAAAASGEAHAP